jgi:hypothetical protein
MPIDFYIVDGIGWEGGERVPVVEPAAQGEEAHRPEGVEVEPFLDALLTAAKDSTEVGERVVFLAYLLSKQGGSGVATGPKSLRELGLWLGCSHVAAATRLNTFKAGFAEELQHSLNTKRPVI